MHLYRIEGFGKVTRRRRKREYQAPDEEGARRMAELEETVVEKVTDLGDMETIQRQWAEEGTKRLLERDLERYGFDDGMWEAAKATVINEKGPYPTTEEIAFAVHRILLAMYTSPEAIGGIYFHIAHFLLGVDEDSRPAMKEFYRQKIRSWKASENVTGVRVMVVAGCCAGCRKRDGMEMTLDDALRDPPVSCPTCTAKVYGDEDKYPWCRCDLSPVLRAQV